MSLGQATREVLACEWKLLRAHRKLALAFLGVLFVPAVYAWIYLFAMWDPASHTRDLPAGLVNLDTGAKYRDRSLNLGSEVITSIERQGQFAYRVYEDAQQARRDVRRGRLAFVLEVPPDFSQRALPGEQPGAAKLTIYTSEGNNYASAGFARRFAPEVAQRVNTMLAEARWDLVLSSAAGSQRDLESLRTALADLHKGASDMQAGATCEAHLAARTRAQATSPWNRLSVFARGPSRWPKARSSWAQARGKWPLRCGRWKHACPPNRNWGRCGRAPRPWPKGNRNCWAGWMRWAAARGGWKPA